MCLDIYFLFLIPEPSWFQSQPQLILQLTMLLNEWEKDDRHVSQAVSLGVHTTILTYHIAGKLYWMWHQNFYSNALLEHYFFEASGKGREKLFSYKLVMRIVPFSLFNFTGGWGRCDMNMHICCYVIHDYSPSFGHLISHIWSFPQCLFHDSHHCSRSR